MAKAQKEPRFRIAHLFQDGLLQKTFYAIEGGLDSSPALPAPSDQQHQIETIARERIKEVIRASDKAAARFAINRLSQACDLAKFYELGQPFALIDLLAIIGLAFVVGSDASAEETAQ